ncbi:MAG: hypothetical protein JNM85_08835 [Chthonomonas sp.]|nr:hypothetical protein [Chthonomonas sp.]
MNKAKEALENLTGQAATDGEGAAGAATEGAAGMLEQAKEAMSGGVDGLGKLAAGMMEKAGGVADTIQDKAEELLKRDLDGDGEIGK